MGSPTQARPTVKLSDATLSDLPDHVLRPRYDRAALKPRILHIGVGNFHRAHQAWYLHRLMQKGLAQDWAIIGAGVRPYDHAMRQKLAAQDYLTTLIELDPDGQTQIEVVGAMIDYVPIADGNGPLIAAMSDPAIRIVSLTVTEGGYYIDPATGAFDPDHPDILHDVAHPGTPRTAFGAMIAALQRRRTAKIGPFTGQSCDNLRGNGEILRRTILEIARRIDTGLAEWIATHMTFPNSMVDSIVPATGADEIALARHHGIDDAAPATHENFRQWVIEDRFCAGRPDWDQVGATFSDDVHAYETMKIRILNAGHQLIANPGEVLNLPTIADCMADPDIAGFFRKVETQEIAPHVAPVPNMTAEAYIDLIAQRFANPAVRDTSRRVAFDGASRHPGFVLPILRDALASNTNWTGLCLSEALWARMCAGRREDGSEIVPNDPHWTELQRVAHAAREAPLAWLNQRQFYGSLSDDPQVADCFASWLNLIWDKGTRAALHRYIDGPG